MTVRTALEGHLQLWLGAQEQALLCAWENHPFETPSVDVTYLRAYLMPGNRSGLSLCEDQEAGVFQVSIFTEKDVGTARAEAIGNAICDHFKPGQYTGFQVLSPPYFTRGMNTDDSRYLLPVSIFYRAPP